MVRPPSAPSTSCACFSLLPMIQDLDPSRAEQLLRDNPKMKAMLEQYPQGMKSLDSRLTSTPRRKGESSEIFTISRGPIADPQEYKREADMEKQRKPFISLREVTLIGRSSRRWPSGCSAEGDCGGKYFCPAVVRQRRRPYRPEHGAESTVALNHSMARVCRSGSPRFAR